MVWWLFRQYFQKRKQLGEADVAAAGLLRGMLETEAATSKMQAEARASHEPYVLLTPMIPISREKPAGWFGGAPHLPDDLPWPEIEGKPARFLCQIDLSAVPAALWSGLGPRQGWLVVFLHPDKIAPKVLHVDGVVRNREGPGQVDACWFWPQSYDDKPLQSHLPEWPLTMASHVGDFPAPYGQRKGKAPGFPDPQDAESRDLADPAFHPFNEATLVALIVSLSEYLELQTRRLDDFLTKKKLRDNDRTELARFKREADRSLEQFSRIKDELLPFTEGFDAATVDRLVSQIAPLPTYQLRYLKNDEDGYAVLNCSQLKLCDRPSDVVGWYSRYENALYRHSRLAYTSGSASLPRELLRRMEAIWQFEALHEAAAMGHAPQGHLYTPHGPSTKNVVLLELPTSNMVGWIWGDTYSLVLFINRDALARGDFDCVTADITN